MALNAKRILFVSHSASRNGATILLLHFLRWLKEHADCKFEVLTQRGELLEEFRAVGRTLVWRNPAFLLASLPAARRRRLTPKLEALCLKWHLLGRQYDLVYVNTIATWQHVPRLADTSQSLLWHVHELDYARRLIMGEEVWQKTSSRAKRFVAVSRAVYEMLTGRLNVSPESVDTVHGFVESTELSDEDRNRKRQQIRKQLGWPEHSFVVGGCGALGWRKGSDVFIQVASQMRRKGYCNTRFLWVGGGVADKEALEFDHDVRAFALEGHCKRVPSTSNALDYYYAMDVFGLTSREDPFPLVMLEAGAVGVPTICFAESGGGPEFVGEDAGLVAPFLEARAFAAHLMRLHDDRSLCKRLGGEAARRVQTTYSVENQAPKLLRSIDLCLQRRQAASPTTA